MTTFHKGYECIGFGWCIVVDGKLKIRTEHPTHKDVASAEIADDGDVRVTYQRDARKVPAQVRQMVVKMFRDINGCTRKVG
jgi:hypothetical protein